MREGYINANHWTEKRIAKVHKKMAKIGIRPERPQPEWISAAEGTRFARVMQGLVVEILGGSRRMPMVVSPGSRFPNLAKLDGDGVE